MPLTAPAQRPGAGPGLAQLFPRVLPSVCDGSGCVAWAITNPPGICLSAAGDAPGCRAAVQPLARCCSRVSATGIWDSTAGSQSWWDQVAVLAHFSYLDIIFRRYLPVVRLPVAGQGSLISLPVSPPCALLGWAGPGDADPWQWGLRGRLGCWHSEAACSPSYWESWQYPLSFSFLLRLLLNVSHPLCFKTGVRGT